MAVFCHILVLSVLTVIVVDDGDAAKVLVRYKNHLENAGRLREVGFETYARSDRRYLFQTDNSTRDRRTEQSRTMSPRGSFHQVTRPIGYGSSSATTLVPEVQIDPVNYSGSDSGCVSGIGYEISFGLFKELGDNITDILGDAHRVYQVCQLKFRFPFYGHAVDAVRVSTGGFLYTGTIYTTHKSTSHSTLLLSWQISILLCTTSGRVLVYSTEEKFTVQWDCHATDGPPYRAPLGPCTAATNGPPGPSMSVAPQDVPPAITGPPQNQCFTLIFIHIKAIR